MNKEDLFLEVINLRAVVKLLLNSLSDIANSIAESIHEDEEITSPVVKKPMPAPPAKKLTSGSKSKRKGRPKGSKNKKAKTETITETINPSSES